MRRSLAAAALVLAGCSSSAVTATREGPDELVVRRGKLVERLILTGELEAVQSDELKVPRTDTWQLSIRWMEEDGKPVHKGDKVVEFDNSQIVSQRQDAILRALRAANDLDRQEAANQVAITDHRLAVERAQIAFDKADLEASVPRDSVSRRTFEQRKLARSQAKFALDQATQALEAAEKAGALDLKVKRIELSKATRAIESTERALSELVLEATRDGVMSIADHPWEGRKLEPGDTVWPGMVVVEFPELSEMQVVAKLSDVDDGRVHPGMKVTATLDAHSDRAFAGTVSSVSPVAREPSTQSQRRSFDVTVKLDESDEELMIPGMSVKVEIATPGDDGRLLVSRRAIDVTGEPAVRRIDGRTVEVKLGRCDAHDCEIASGLSEGDVLQTAEAAL